MHQDDSPKPDYSFITNPAAPPKKTLLSGNSLPQRLLIAVAGFGVLLVIIIIFISVVFGGNTSNTTRLVNLAAQQAELIRVAELGAKDASSAETKNFASTVDLSLTSAQNDLTALISRQGHKLKPTELTAAKNSQTDTALTTASQTNRFDATFNQTMKTSLQSYLEAVKSAYDASASKSEKAALQTLYTNTKLLFDTVPAS